MTVRPIGSAVAITIGSGFFLNTEVRFGGAQGGIRIGSGVQIGPRVQFETVSHGLSNLPGRGRGFTTAPIVVEDGVWVGAGAIILQGVTIGRGAAVAAGAVVNRDVPPETLAGGAPARVLRSLGEPSEENEDDREGRAG